MGYNRITEDKQIEENTMEYNSMKWNKRIESNGIEWDRVHN